jgi:formylglycine-generating enzyme
MKMLRLTIVLSSLLLASPAGRPAWADVLNMGGTRDAATGQWTGLASLEFVPVGDPGNVENSTKLGRVGYSYRMGTHEVTTAQYCQFLNAVAKSDPCGLYNTLMANTASNYPGPGCGITRGTTDGGYTYSVVSGRENLPVNMIDWGDAARFVNWLANGQPAGQQGPGTTETGSYTLN